jgi:hypothetical protein
MLACMTLQQPETASPRVTNKVDRKNGGMPEWAVLGVGKNHEGKWVTYWPYTSDIDGKRFLTRFMPLRTPWVSVDITRIHSDDGERTWPHDHSRSFISWKFGWYAENVHDDPDDLTVMRHIRHRRFGMHLLRHSQAHSITEVSPKLWTILFLGPKRGKSSYWTPDGFQTIGMGVDQDPGQTEWA